MNYRTRAFSALTLFGIAGSFLFPFLIPVHTAPLPAFYSEWSAALFILLACLFTVFLPAAENREARLPMVALLFAALIGVFVLQLNLGMLAYAYNAIFPIMYCLVAIAATILGAFSVKRFGLAKLLYWISVACISGGVLSILIQVIQLYHAEGYFSPLVVQRPDYQIYFYANLAQQNLLATYLSWSLVCTLYLFSNKLLRARYAIALAVAILFGIALTGSRMTWLQISWIAAAGWFLLWRMPTDLRPRNWQAVIGLPLCYMLVTFSLPYISKLAHFDFGVSALDRVVHTGTLDFARRVIYAQAWEIFLEHPILGVGPGEFQFQQFLLMDRFPGKAEMASSAHNLILDLLVATGAIGTLLFLGIFAAWFWRTRKQYQQLETICILLMLTVFGIHSMLEYPEWHGFFLWPAAFFLGCLETRFVHIKHQFLQRMAPAVGGIAGLVLSVALYREYRNIESINLLLNSAKNATAEQILAAHPEERAHVYRAIFLRPQSDALLSVIVPFDNVDLARKIDMSERAMRWNLSAYLIYRHIVWLGMANRQDEALSYVVRLGRLHAKHFPDMAADLMRLSEGRPDLFGKIAAQAKSLTRM